jgi:hypothetical protein
VARQRGVQSTGRSLTASAEAHRTRLRLHCTLYPRPPRHLARQRRAGVRDIGAKSNGLTRLVLSRGGRGAPPGGLKSVPQKFTGALTFHARQIFRFSFPSGTIIGAVSSLRGGAGSGQGTLTGRFPEPIAGERRIQAFRKLARRWSRSNARQGQGEAGRTHRQTSGENPRR